MVWYHDHAYGITRTNAYAGLASAYLITDDAETTLVNLGIIPSAMIPLVIQDKSFWDGGLTDPGYSSAVPAGASSGSLWYPHTYEGPPLPDMTIPAACGSGTGRWDLEGTNAPPVSLIPEAFADVILVNGAPWPKVEVKRQRYRLRLLNGSQARFFNLQWYLADGSPDGITLRDSGEKDSDGNHQMVPANRPGPKVIQIGTEGGFLPAPVVLNNPPLPIGFYQNRSNPNDPKNGNANRYNLLLAPAERADLIIDFSDVPAGASVVLYNDATAPFPGGDIRYDYYGGGPDLTCIGGAAPPSAGLWPGYPGDHAVRRDGGARRAN